jgi:ribosomal protein L18
MENETNCLSLFDYLGKAAGSELGKKVAEEASKNGIEYKLKDVKNINYTGKIMCYPVEFLNKYFND